MATIQEGYSAKYQKTKSSKLRSVSPSHYENADQSPRPHVSHNNGQMQLGKVVSQLTDRVDGLQIKIVNITNIMKLFQKYTETKDIQYQKQKQNDQFRKNIGERAAIHTQSLQTQTKINQLQTLIQRTKSQITAMQGLRITIQRQNSKKIFHSPQPFETIPKTIQSPTNTNTEVLMQQIQDIMDKMQINLREQINKKIDICMTFVKNATQAYNSNNNSRNSSPSAVNAIMMQQQLHNMTLTVNKVQSDCYKNKMLLQSKIEQIVDYVNSLRKDDRDSKRSHSRSAPRRTINNAEQDYSQNSSISKKSKNKSKSQGKKNNTQRNHSFLEQQKKQKQIQLRQALKKKKQNQQKLKMKK